MSTVTYLDRFLDPVVEVSTPALARKIVDLRADPELEERIAELRKKANHGTLTLEERPSANESILTRRASL